MAHEQIVELEFIIAEYAEMYGLTEARRDYFKRQEKLPIPEVAAPQGSPQRALLAEKSDL